jgi:peptidyl-prolyl cis-trans isomerase C
MALFLHLLRTADRMKARPTMGKAPRAAIALALCVLALAACHGKPAGEAPPLPGDREVARVNGAAIWASDVKREAVIQGLIGQGEPLDVSSEVFHQVLDQVVDQKLLAVEAARRGLDKDVVARRRLAAARERVLDDLLLETSVGKAVNDDAVKGLYQEMLKTQTPSQEIHLRQIVLGSQAEADQVRKLLAGGAAFDALAAERSKDDATRFKGGELAPLTLDVLPQAYAGPLKDAQVGQIVGPFKTDAGWVVARLDDRHQEANISFEVAKPQIIRFLTYDRVKDLILELRHGAKVETLIPPVQATPREPASAPAVSGGAITADSKPAHAPIKAKP